MTKRLGCTSAGCPLAAGLLVLLALLAPSTLAQPEAARHEVSLSVLEYHPWPDMEAVQGKGGDPFGVPAHEGAAWDRMHAYYGAYAFPTARFDGVLESSYAEERVENDLQAFHDAYEGRVLERLREGSPIVVNLSGALDGTRGTATATFVPTAAVQSARVALRVVVFEDDVEFDGGNDVLVHRFMARANLPVEHVTLEAGRPVTVTRAFNVSPEWDVENLGLVAFAQNEDPNAAAWDEKEVLQSATFYYRQDGPTVQARKAVLLELYTATWCPPCLYGDGATDLLAAEYGVASAAHPPPALAYYRAPSGWQVAVAFAAAGALALALWPRRGAGAGP